MKTCGTWPATVWTLAGSAAFLNLDSNTTAASEMSGQQYQDETRLRAAAETAVDGVILIDALGRVLMFDRVCERMFGYHATEVIGENVKMLMPDPFRGEHDRYIENFRRTDVAKIIGIGREVVGRRKDGTTFPMDLSVGEAKQEGESVFVGMIRDVTERKRTEAQLARAREMETVAQLSARLAHDLNKLLTVMIGNAETLGDRLKERPELKTLADQIIAAGERGAELTARFLALGRARL